MDFSCRNFLIKAKTTVLCRSSNIICCLRDCCNLALYVMKNLRLSHCFSLWVFPHVLRMVYNSASQIYQTHIIPRNMIESSSTIKTEKTAMHTSIKFMMLIFSFDLVDVEHWTVLCLYSLNKSD